MAHWSTGLPTDIIPTAGDIRLIKTDDKTTSLFKASDDIMCPITHQIYRDPVITTAGMIYERSAIEAHLRTKMTDPLTNQAISANLVPVFKVKEMAQRYAEATANECLAAMSEPECFDPLQYLVRACEVCVESGICDRFPQLEPTFAAKAAAFGSMASAAQHSTPISLLLPEFADCLSLRGLERDARAVLAICLRRGNWPFGKREVLAQCLPLFRAPAAGPSGAAQERRADRRGEGEGTETVAGYHPATMVHFFEEQRTLPALEFLQHLEALGVPRPALAAVCGGIIEQLQSSMKAVCDAVAPPPATGATAVESQSSRGAGTSNLSQQQLPVGASSPLNDAVMKSRAVCAAINGEQLVPLVYRLIELEGEQGKGKGKGKGQSSGARVGQHLFGRRDEAVEPRASRNLVASMGRFASVVDDVLTFVVLFVLAVVPIEVAYRTQLRWPAWLCMVVVVNVLMQQRERGSSAAGEGKRKVA